MPQETENQQLFRIETAKNLIRRPYLARIVDISFVVPCIFAIFLCLAAYHEKIAWELAVTIIGLIVGIFTSAEKNKDASIGAAAVKPPKDDA